TGAAAGRVLDGGGTGGAPGPGGILCRLGVGDAVCTDAASEAHAHGRAQTDGAGGAAGRSGGPGAAGMGPPAGGKSCAARPTPGRARALPRVRGPDAPLDRVPAVAGDGG